MLPNDVIFDSNLILPTVGPKNPSQAHQDENSVPIRRPCAPTLKETEVCK